MRHRAYAPHPTLRPYVRCLRVQALPAGTERTLLPDSAVEVVFAAGAPLLLTDGRDTWEPPAGFRIALLSQSIMLRAPGPVTIVAARLYAWGAIPLLGAGAPPVSSPVVPLDAPWARVTDAIVRASVGGDDDGAVALLQRALLDRLVTAPTVPAGLLAAAHLLHATGGRLSVRDAAGHAGLSPRHLERVFATWVEVPPKALARTVRFERARDRLWVQPETDLATLAQTYGFADQAHLTREFRAFAGEPPARFAAALRAGRAPRSGPDRDVASVQAIAPRRHHTRGVSGET